ncbi:MAG TPA: hypothetical protein VFS21_37530 [Roseiflexaceae bacterium]|nr:hypothetical protein [Roseiflexaceae bacterium]
MIQLSLFPPEPQVQYRREHIPVVVVSPALGELRPLLRHARLLEHAVSGEDVGRLSVALREHQAILLDTMRLPPVRLAQLLVWLGRQVEHQRMLSGIAALVDRADGITPILLSSASIALPHLLVEELATRRDELRELPSTVCVPQPPLGLPAGFLEVFAALEGASTIDEVALRCHRSRSATHRCLAATRAALGLPAGHNVRYRPKVLLAEILTALRQLAKAGGSC